MDLRRAASKFANSPILTWDSTTSDWRDSGSNGALQAFDRFVTERTFGQKKRIMLVDPGCKLEDDVTVIRIQGSEEAFIVEKFNEDIRFGKLYSYVYLLHESPYYVEVCKTETETNAAGVDVGSTEVVLESTWIDMDRFSAAPSRTFEDTEMTILSMTFPKDSIVDTDCYAKTSNGDRYNVDEIYYSLDVISAKGKRIGKT